MGHISCIVDERKSLSRPAYDIWRMTHDMGQNMTGLVSNSWGDFQTQENRKCQFLPSL
jgi:hypothetical protein